MIEVLSHAPPFMNIFAVDGKITEGRGKSLQDSHYSGYNPRGAFFTVIMGTSVIGSTEVPIIIVKHVDKGVTV